jgi:hypothetical protein
MWWIWERKQVVEVAGEVNQVNLASARELVDRDGRLQILFLMLMGYLLKLAMLFQILSLLLSFLWPQNKAKP